VVVIVIDVVLQAVADTETKIAGLAQGEMTAASSRELLAAVCNFK
jgi:hypothetical protein